MDFKVSETRQTLKSAPESATEHGISGQSFGT